VRPECNTAVLVGRPSTKGSVRRKVFLLALEGFAILLLINVVWGDPRPGSGRRPTVDYALTNTRGQSTELLLGQRLTKPIGGPQALDGKRVEVVGTSKADGQIRVESIELAQAEEAAADSAMVSATTVGITPNRYSVLASCSRIGHLADVPILVAHYHSSRTKSYTCKKAQDTASL
jgi:hypothetical protein